MKTRNLVLVLLVLIGRAAFAQSWLLLTVEGTGGDTGYVAAGFSDAAGNSYSASYQYTQSDTPATVASNLVVSFTNLYGYLGLTAGSTGATLGVKLPSSVVQATNDDNFYNIWMSPSGQVSYQSLYVAYAGYTAPSVPGEAGSAAAAASDAKADAGVTVTQNSDGSITISAPGQTTDPANPAGVASNGLSTVMAVNIANGVLYITVPDPTTATATLWNATAPTVFTNPSDPQGDFTPLDEQTPNSNPADLGSTTVSQAMTPVSILSISDTSMSVSDSGVTYTTTVYYSDGTALSYSITYSNNSPCN